MKCSDKTSLTIRSYFQYLHHHNYSQQRSSTVDPYAVSTSSNPKHSTGRSTSVGPTTSTGSQIYSSNPPYVPPQYAGSHQQQPNLPSGGQGSSGAPSPYGFGQQEASSPPPHYSEHGSYRRTREGSYGYQGRVRYGRCLDDFGGCLSNHGLLTLPISLPLCFLSTSVYCSVLTL